MRQCISDEFRDLQFKIRNIHLITYEIHIKGMYLTITIYEIQYEYIAFFTLVMCIILSTHITIIFKTLYHRFNKKVTLIFLSLCAFPLQ